jgi:HK97 family phage prohead protease
MTQEQMATTLKSFKLYTSMLRAYEATDAAGVSRKKFKTTASSTIKDLAGDEIQYPAIEKMAGQARGNMTIFLNHSYNVPEDVLGSCEDAQVIKRGVDGEGNDIIDLDFDIGLNESNPRALQAWDAIKSGVKLGTSIGAIVRHATKKKGGGLLIDDVDLLEASLVGIPANPRSWVQNAVKSLTAIEDPLIDEELDADFELTESGVPEDLLTKDAEEPVEETKDVEPDKEAARTQVTVTVDSEPAQEAPKSDPGNATDSLLDETAQGDDAMLGDSVTRTGDDLVDVMNRFADSFGQIESLTKDIADLTVKNAELTRERDEALANLDLAKQLFSRIEQLPLRRKTAPIPTESKTRDYSKFAGVYDAEVIKLLEKKS